MIKINFIWIFFIGLITFTIGTLLGRFSSTPLIEFDSKVSIVHAISIFTPVLIAVVVGIMLDQNKESKKIKRDLVLRRVDELYKTVDDIQLLLLDNNAISLLDITFKLKNIGALISTVNAVIFASGFLIDNRQKLVIEKHKDLRELMTKTDITSELGSVAQDIQVSESLCAYSNNRKAQIENCIRDLRQEIFNMQIDIASS